MLFDIFEYFEVALDESTNGDERIPHQYCCAMLLGLRSPKAVMKQPPFLFSQQSVPPLHPEQALEKWIHHWLQKARGCFQAQAQIRLTNDGVVLNSTEYYEAYSAELRSKYLAGSKNPLNHTFNWYNDAVIITADASSDNEVPYVGAAITTDAVSFVTWERFIKAAKDKMNKVVLEEEPDRDTTLEPDQRPLEEPPDHTEFADGDVVREEVNFSTEHKAALSGCYFPTQIQLGKIIVERASLLLE